LMEIFPFLEVLLQKITYLSHQNFLLGNSILRQVT